MKFRNINLNTGSKGNQTKVEQLLDYLAVKLLNIVSNDSFFLCRLKFEQQLHLLIEQHKNLRSIFVNLLALNCISIGRM